MKKQLLYSILLLLGAFHISGYSQVVCGGTFTDSGGIAGNYSINENQTTTICPSNPGEVVSVTFTSFDLENNFDKLKVYDGASASDPLIVSLTGTTIPNVITSSNANGCLTFVFTSDSSIVRSGWNADVTCAPPVIVTCPKPTNLSVTSSAADVTVSWQEMGSATQWEVLALPSGTAPTASSVGIITSVNPYVFSGLTGTNYVFYVRAICSTSEISNWSNAVLYSIPSCLSVPTGVFANSITSNSATISWYNSGITNQYEILVQPHGTVTPTASSTGIAVNGDSYILTGLNCLASYDVYVRKNCTTTLNSNWSNVFTFSTLEINATINLPSLEQCDGDGDGLVIFDMTNQVTSTNPISYYANLTDASSQTNAIANLASYVISATAPNTTIFVRETITGSCQDNMYSFQLHAYADCNLAHNCNQANSLCSALGNPFANTHQGIHAEVGLSNNYGCLGSTPNPTWFYLPVSDAGTINLTIEQSSTINFVTNNLDVDYIIYGPFTDPIAPCSAGLNQSNTISCSFSAAAVEHPVIPNAQVGEYYLLMTTNFSNQPGFIRISDDATSTGAIDCSGLRLNAFLDSNANGSQDIGESNFPLGQFNYEMNSSGNVHHITSPTGVYNIYDVLASNAYDLSYTIDPTYIAMYNLTTASYTNVHVVIGGGMVTYNFPITTTQNYDDLAIAIVPSNAPRAGFVYSNKIVYSNLGNQTIASGTLSFDNNVGTTITVISQTGTTATATGFTYNFTNLAPFETRTITVTMSVPAIPLVSIGQLLTNTASIVPPTGDVNLVNNNSSSTQAIIASYDPNDKTESHGEKILFSTFSANDYLNYTIRFENTGTISAINVHVNDVLDNMIDQTSLRMIAASHPYTLDRTGNTLNWNFDNIQLPVSVSGTNTGKGYVTFMAKLKPGFAVGDIIPNTANIYFDTNPAIVTNTFNTEFLSTLNNVGFDAGNFVMYPNPATNNVQIRLQNSTENLESVIVYDVLGKSILKSTNVTSNVISLDVSDVSSGIYFVEIKTQNNLKQTKKLVIK